MAKRNIDWEAIEQEYRIGLKTLKSIGAEYGVSDAAIVKKAKKLGWPRDLRAKIKAKAAAKVSAASVSKEVSEQQKLTEREIVEVNAEMQAQALMAHRTDIARHRQLSQKLLSELEATTDNIDLAEQLNAIINGDTTGLDAAYQRIISLPSRTDTAKKMAETLKTLITMEREALGIDDRKSPGQTLDAFLDGIASAED